MINSINLCDLVEILNVRIINAATIRDSYTDFSDDDDFRARTKWDGIVDELCEIRDEFEARIVK